MAYEALHEFLPVSYKLLVFPSCSLFQPHWFLCHSVSKPRAFPPWELCPCCLLSLEWYSPGTCSAYSIPSCRCLLNIISLWRIPLSIFKAVTLLHPLWYGRMCHMLTSLFVYILSLTESSLERVTLSL